MAIETLAVRRAGDSGRNGIGWLESRHSFSFGQYDDPEHLVSGRCG